MLAKELSELRNYMVGRGILFSFSGYMTEDILSGIGGAIKKKMAIEQADRQTTRGLFTIFVELVQNVIRYSAENEIMEDGNSELLDLRYGVLTVGRKENRYFVACGNLVETRDVPRLRQELDHIKGLDKLELKTLYKETLRGEVPEHSKGAGVGFIEIARKSEQGFEFDFYEYDDDKSFFSLEAYI